MKCRRWFSIILIIVSIGIGCASVSRQPVMQQAVVNPAAIQPGAHALIAVEIVDQYGIVARVEGTLKEDPSIPFVLRDDGTNGDEKAGDGIWSLRVDVPFQAPPGMFELDVIAYNSAGDPILVRNKEGESELLHQIVTVQVQFPEKPDAEIQ